MAYQSKTVYEEGEIEREPKGGREGGMEGASKREKERNVRAEGRACVRARARERVRGKEELASQAGIIMSRDSRKHEQKQKHP